MRIKNFQITSPTLDLELNLAKPICILRGEYSDLVLDLIRELIGDRDAKNDPDQFNDGHFVIHSDIEMDGKNYAVCYIRNADFLGDNRIAANFAPNSLEYSTDDTMEFIDKCNGRGKDASNIFFHSVSELTPEDDRPVFVYGFDRMSETEIAALLKDLARIGRQVFVSAPSSFPESYNNNVQNVSMG